MRIIDWISDVCSSDLDGAALRIVEAQQKLEDRRLAGARGADDGDLLARLDREAEALQGGALGARGIVEHYVVEGDGATRRLRQGDRIRRRGDLRLAPQQIEIGRAHV